MVEENLRWDDVDLVPALDCALCWSWGMSLTSARVKTGLHDLGLILICDCAVIGLLLVLLDVFVHAEICELLRRIKLLDQSGGDLDGMVPSPRLTPSITLKLHDQLVR